MCTLVAEPSEQHSIVDITYFFYLTEGAIEKVLKSSGIEGESTPEETEKALKELMIKRGVVFSEHSSLVLNGREIILHETEPNAKLIEDICKELGIDETVHDEWINFEKIEISPYGVDGSSLRFVKIYWNKHMLGSKSVKIIVLKSPKYEVENVLYEGDVEVFESRYWIEDESGGIDPFAQSDAPKAYISMFKVDSRSLDRIYIGTGRPYRDLRSLRQLLELTHNKAGDDNSE